MGRLSVKPKKYLLDTHALFSWVTKEYISEEFSDFIDNESRNGAVYVSTISFWEIALLKKKGRVAIHDLHSWMHDIANFSPAKFIDPTPVDMIDSTILPDIHKDPFDRLLIAQAKNLNSYLVTKDAIITRYKIKTVWL